jgi:hypothetical protein
LGKSKKNWLFDYKNPIVSNIYGWAKILVAIVTLVGVAARIFQFFLNVGMVKDDPAVLVSFDPGVASNNFLLVGAHVDITFSSLIENHSQNKKSIELAYDLYPFKFQDLKHPSAWSFNNMHDIDAGVFRGTDRVGIIAGGKLDITGGDTLRSCVTFGFIF